MAKIRAILPANAEDPANQFPNLRAANRKIRARYGRIYSEIYQFIKTLKYSRTFEVNSWRQPTEQERQDRELEGKRIWEPVLVTNEYNYQLDAAKQNQIGDFIQRLLYGELLGGEERYTPRWWLSSNLYNAYSDSIKEVTETLNDAGNQEPLVNTQEGAIMRRVLPETLLNTPAVQTRLGLVYARVFEGMKGLTDKSRTDLANTLTRAMSDGVGIPEIARRVKKRVGESQSRAMRIARTEILNAYRTATSDETAELNKDLLSESDYKFELLWFSALAPTTRRWHATRHGRTYTKQKVQKFYSEGANAISCLCSQRPILVDGEGNPMQNKKLLERLKKQRETYLSTA